MQSDQIFPLNFEVTKVEKLNGKNVYFIFFMILFTLQCMTAIYEYGQNNLAILLKVSLMYTFEKNT